MIASSKNLKLKKLITQISDLSHISPDILAVAVVRLEEIWLWNTKLTPEQFQKSPDLAFDVI